MPTMVKFWVNAFIPASVCQLLGDTYVMQVDGTVPGWPAPSIWYLAGDQREYSADIHASSRMHSEVEIQALDTDAPAISFQSHNCGESTALDEDGNVTDRATAPTDGMSFFNLRRNQTIDPEGGVIDDSPNPNLVQIDVAGSGRVPFAVAPYVPQIDYVGTFSFDPDTREARFRGGVDGFPAYEFYVTVDNGAAETLGLVPPIDPLELIGDAGRKIDLRVTAA
jgi:hypothetical protein